MTEILTETIIFVEWRYKSIDYALIEYFKKNAWLSDPEKITIKPSKSIKDIKGMLNSGFKEAGYTNGTVKNILIICDADSDSNQTFTDLITELNKHRDALNFNIPTEVGAINKTDTNKINFGIYLFPDNKSAWNLEVLCYENFKTQKLFSQKTACIEEYIKSLWTIDDVHKMTANKLCKAKIYMFLSTNKLDFFNGWTSELINQLDFNVQPLNELKSFIQSVES